MLRITGEGTAHYIDRKAEFHNAAIASNPGVNAEIIHFDTETGIMIYRYIADSDTLDIDRLRNFDVLQRTGQAFRNLHDCEQKLLGEFDLFTQVDQYLTVLKIFDAEVRIDAV